MLSKNQFGFQQGRNTSDAILEFLNNAYDSQNENKYLFVIYHDFSKAFNTVCRAMFLRKLYHLGFRSHVYEGIRSCVSAREQFVSIGQSASDITDTERGVPQGSTLGPLFFLIHINDMNMSLS